MKYVFALSECQDGSSEVHATQTEPALEEAINTLLQDGYEISSVRVVDAEHVKGVTYKLKETSK